MKQSAGCALPIERKKKNNNIRRGLARSQARRGTYARDNFLPQSELSQTTARSFGRKFGLVAGAWTGL
jgi:hypothetical protein